MSAEAGAYGSANIIQSFRLENKPEAGGELLLGRLEPEGLVRLRSTPRPWLAHSRTDYGRMLLTRGRPGDRTRAAFAIR